MVQSKRQQLDLFSPEFKKDPFPIFSYLRHHDPIYCHHAPYGARIWYITRHDDVAAVLKDNERFTKVPPHQWEEANREPPGVFAMINRNMLFADPPAHTRLRALVGQAFTPRRVEALAPRIAAITAALLDARRPAGQMDLIADFALPLPMQVIMELLGIPDGDRAPVYDWSKAIIAPGRHGITLKARKQRVSAFVDYLHTLFAARRQTPQDDLISALVAAEMDGDRLSEAELSSMVALLFVTGHETVVNLIGNGLLALLTHPDQWDRLRADTTLAEAAVEELLRYDGPVETSTTRWARTDLTLRGRQIAAGDVIRVVLTSANRDESRFSHPEALDIGRDGPPHLAFGLGIHYCLGAPLARLEGRLALQGLLTLPGLRPAVDPAGLTWQSGVIFRGVEAFPVCWDH